MRFPVSPTAFYHYVDELGLETRPFPNPLTDAAGSTVIDLAGRTFYAESLADLPPLFREVADAWAQALGDAAHFTEIQTAIRARSVARLKALWNELVPRWDDRTFYDFVAGAKSFSGLPFHHREVFGQVGFGTGGWDSDFPNSMLEILPVVVTNCDSDQRLVVGGVERVPRGLWNRKLAHLAHWLPGTSLASLHAGAPRPGVARIARGADGQLAVTEAWGDTRRYAVVLTTCQSWLLTTQIECDESLFSEQLWMALDRTRYVQSSKTFVMVDRPFWRDRAPRTGRPVMNMTLTDRLTRATYLFDNGADKPGVIYLTYSWMSDAMKMLPEPVDRRVRLCLDVLKKIHPDWTPAWVEGAVQTSLNAVWGVLHHFGGRTNPDKSRTRRCVRRHRTHDPSGLNRVPPMRIAIYQCRPHPDDVAGNLSRLHRAAADAARDRAHLLISPEFPDNAGRLALSGADLIIVPTANMIPYEFVANTIVPARAFENRLYIGYANYCGSEGHIEYRGLSCIASPDGRDPSRAGHHEQLIAADLDHDRMTNSRRINTYLADRVPALCQSLTTEPVV
jgi:hypothetical protein